MKPISYFMFLVVLVLYNSGCTTEKRLLVMASKPETKIISTKKTYALDKKLALSKSKNIQILSSKGEKEYRIKNYKSAEIFFAKVLSIFRDQIWDPPLDDTSVGRFQVLSTWTLNIGAWGL